MWVETVAAENALFSLCAMFSVFLLSLNGALALWGNMIWSLIWECLLTGSECSAEMNLSNKFSFFEVSVVVIGIVFSFRNTVVYFGTWSMLALDATMAAMLWRATRCEYVWAKV